MTKQEELEKLKKLYARRHEAYERVCDKCGELAEQLDHERMHASIIQTEMNRIAAQIVNLATNE